MRKGRLNKEI